MANYTGDDLPAVDPDGDFLRGAIVTFREIRGGRGEGEASSFKRGDENSRHVRRKLSRRRNRKETRYSGRRDKSLSK